MDTHRWNSLIRLVTFGALGLQLAGCSPGASDETAQGGALVSRTAGVDSDAVVTRTRVVLSDPVKPAPTTGTTTTTTPPPAAPPPPIAPPPTTPLAQAVESGVGWQHMRVSGTAYDTQQATVVTLGDEYYVINGRDAIPNTPLPDALRSALSAKMKGAPPPADGDEEILIIPSGVITASQSPNAAFALCDDDDNQVYATTYAIDQTFPYHVDTQDTFSGSGDFSVRLHGTVTGSVKYDIKRFACVPYPVIHRVGVQGNADVVADATIDASFSDKWSWSYQVADPTIGTVTLPVVPIPITFTAPITIGIDADAQAQLHAHATYEASANFVISCNGNGCAGDHTATSTFSPGGSPSFAVNGTVNVTPWAKAAIHANVITDSIAYGEVGVRARLPGQLWAYAGNTCGDGNADGSPEFVSAATLDLGAAIDITAAAGFIGIDLGPWSWSVWNDHLGFWTIGDASALNPIFYPTWPTLDALRTARMLTRMRPCWPYADAVTYQVTWNDGATSTVTGAPGTLLEVDHPYASYGTMVVDITAVSDAKGRNLGGTAESKVWLSPVDYGAMINNTAGFAQ